MTDTEEHGRARLRGLAIHFAAFLLVGGASVAINLLVYPEHFFSAFVVVVWGAPLALHVAYVMGLFDAFGRGNE